MPDSVNMSLDEIIKQNRISRPRGRGGAPTRGRGGGRGGAVGGRGSNRGGGGRGRGRGRGRGGGSNSRSGTPGPRQGRSRSRGPETRGRSQSRARSQSRGRSQSRTRSRSRQRFRSNSRARSMSWSRSQPRRALTPKGRAGLDDQQPSLPALVRNNRFNRGGQQNRLLRSNSNPNLRGGIHSRLGVNRGRGRPLAVAKRGISKRGQGLSTNNRYSAVGLRSDQILQEQRRNFFNQSTHIRTQTFTRSRSRSRSRNNSFNAASQLTVSVANDFSKRRRNSVGNAGFLTRQNLAQLTNQYGGYNARRGPGSVKSVASNRSNRSNKSNYSNRSTRARGRGANRGVSRKFVNKQILNPKLQEEIASIQGKTLGGTSVSSEPPAGINFSPIPFATSQSLHERFAST